MSVCDLQGIPKDVLCDFRPAQHRHRRPEKAGDHHAMNYTPKSPLSLRAARRYVVDQSCQKPAIPGLLNAPPNRLDGDRAKRAPRRPRLAVAIATVRSEALRNRSNHPCHQVMTNNESASPPARIGTVRALRSDARCNRPVRCEFPPPTGSVVGSMAPADPAIPRSCDHVRGYPEG